MSIPLLRSPVVLVHGLFGFDHIHLGPWLRMDYFRGIPTALSKAGNRVHVVRLHPTGGIVRRARELRDFLQNRTNEPVHIIAHSLGGLDARYMISHLGMAKQVLTLTTLGTPHRGSPFADWASTRLVRLFGPVLDFFQLPRQAFADLTTWACEKFNRNTPNVPGVRYYSIAGQYRASWMNPAWKFTAPIVEKAEGPSDGIVSISSAEWGVDCDVWEGDHLDLVNFPHTMRARGKDTYLPRYVKLLGRLRDEGF